ncbi:hypothetical protein NUW58_g7885 [Xylaria curta]|uniref:Uncharacterized protein n=1 Tax=Xylaria curta TaxID=42375 RepID=A0ACC1NDQ9_9PEZI|nr:hypothetical protein NUW58_g7885 [Xylaria curta]
MYSREIQGTGNTNLALRDMRKALAWVQENIGAFGGDAGSVTIWGESAGSFAVGQLLMSYGGRTDGLFHRSIQESGSAATAWHNGSDWYQPIYDNIVEQANCTEAIDTLDCLRTVDYDVLFPLLNYTAIPGPGWYPTSLFLNIFGSWGLILTRGRRRRHPGLVSNQRAFLLPHVGTYTYETGHKMEALVLRNLEAAVDEGKMFTIVPEQKGLDWVPGAKDINS